MQLGLVIEGLVDRWRWMRYILSPRAFNNRVNLHTERLYEGEIIRFLKWSPSRVSGGAEDVRIYGVPRP